MSDQAPDVTIVGAGIAGMSAALKLLEAGFTVKVIEASGGLGGKFGARRAKHGYHDFAWHILADWCKNFWSIAATLGLGKDADFEPRPRLTLLRPRATTSPWPRAASVSAIGSPDDFWSNVNSGVAHWSDLILYTYGLYALLSDQDIDREEFLNRVEVNGYMRSLPYLSDVAALLHNELLLRIWAIPSYLISVRSYQTHLKTVAPFTASPSAVVVMKKDFEEGFWTPFRRVLERHGPRFTLVSDTRLTGIRLAAGGDRVSAILVQGRNDPTPRAETVRSLIVAIPADSLLQVVSNADSAALRGRVPELLDLAKLEFQRTASLTLYFKRRIEMPGVGDEPVSLLDDLETVYAPDNLAQRNGLASRYALSLIEIGRLRGDRCHQTVLSVLASDADSLASLDDREAAARVIDELRRYVAFDPGDIDWEYSDFQGHRGEPLFVNSVGSWEYRPEVRSVDGKGNTLSGQVWGTVRNLYLAGDYCRSQIDFVSLEGAIHTGLWAAHALSAHALAQGAPGVGLVAPPIAPEPFDRARAEEIKRRLEPWARLAARRSRLERATLKEAARCYQSPPSPVPSSLAEAAAMYPTARDGGAVMSDALSTSPGFATPIQTKNTGWLHDFRKDSTVVHLRSGARISVPLLFWEAQALQVIGVADADAVDEILQETGGQPGLRATRVDDKATAGAGTSFARVEIWAPHYGGTTVGPIKAVFALIQVESRRDCRRRDDRGLPHYWWWWYYSNSAVNHEFKRDVWGVPNELTQVEASYISDQKEVRLLETGRTILRLRCEQRVDRSDDRTDRVKFRTVARRSTDDGENLSEVLIHGSVYPVDITMHVPEDTTVHKLLKRVSFQQVREGYFFSGYNGVVKMYDEKGVARPPSRRSADGIVKIQVPGDLSDLADSEFPTELAEVVNAVRDAIKKPGGPE